MIVAEAVLAVNPPVPVHEYVSAPEATILVVGVVQLMVAVAEETVTVGVILFSVITTLAEAVQPLPFVPMTVYVPPAVIVAIAVEAVNPPVPDHS